MRYEKPWSSVDDQIQLLTAKGLECGDVRELRCALNRIGYYRLSAYWFPYKITDDEGKAVFAEGTSFEEVMNNYNFDRDLRFLMFGAIAEIEVYFRSRLSYLAAGEDGVFGYPASTVLRLNREYSAAKRSEQFAKHFDAKYGDEHDLPPYWMMVEVATMGTIELLFSKVSPRVRVAVASELGIKVPVLRNWLSVLRVARNACCHHSRVWNRVWGVRPVIPRDWEGFGASNSRTFAVLSVLCYLLDAIEGADSWKGELDALFDDYKDIDLGKVGLPDAWQDTAPWCGVDGVRGMSARPLR